MDWVKEHNIVVVKLDCKIKVKWTGIFGEYILYTVQYVQLYIYRYLVFQYGMWCRVGKGPLDQIFLGHTILNQEILA